MVRGIGERGGCYGVEYVKPGREFWNGLGFEYLTLLLLKIRILGYKCSSMFHL
jgi:hypothetical protein